MKTASPTFILVNVAVVGVLTALVFMNTCCTGDQTLSPCTSSEQCNLSPGGECLASPLGENLCAYPNQDCENTSLAWGSLSGELSGKCVVDTVAPTIVSKSPDDAAKDVGTAINITVEFSEPIDLATLSTSTFKVTQGTATVEGTYAASGNTAVFSSTVRLAPNAMYSVALSTDIADRAGNKLAAGSTWSFSTRSGGWQAPQILKTDAAAQVDDLITNFDDAGHGAAVWIMNPCSSATVCDAGTATVWGSVYNAGAWSTPAALTTSTLTAIPNVTVDANGNATAVWYQYSSISDTAASVMASHYSTGSGWSSPATVGADLAGSALSRPSVDADAAGNVFAVWQQRIATPDVWWARMSSGGTWTSPARLENSSGAAAVPAVGVATNGTTAAVWEQPAGTIQVSRYNNGVFESSTPVKTSTPGFPTIRSAPDGSLHVLWFSTSDLWWFRYGSAWSTPVTIDSSSDALYYNTELAFDAGGQGIAVWSQGSAAQQSAYYAVYDPNNGWGTAKQLESNIGTAGNMSVTYGRSLSAMAMWIQPSGGSGYSVWSSVRNNSTDKWSVPELVETDDSGDASRPWVFFDPTQNVFHSIWMQVTSGKHRSVYIGSFE